MTNLYKVIVVGDIQKAGKDAYKIERIENEVFESYMHAEDALWEIVAYWYNPSAIFDICSIKRNMT